MPAYVIFIRERTLDQSELDAYARAAPPSLEGWPIKFLAAYGRQDVLEGPEPDLAIAVPVRRGGRTVAVLVGFIISQMVWKSVSCPDRRMRSGKWTS